MTRSARFAARTVLPNSESEAERQLADLARLAAVGCRVARVRVPWATFIPQPGRIDASVRERLAAFVAGLHALGIEPHLALCGRRVPGWFVDDLAFADERRADRHWSTFVDGVLESTTAEVGGIIPFEAPLAMAHQLHGAHLGPDNQEVRRFLAAIECVSLLMRRTATLAGTLDVTYVIDRSALSALGTTAGLAGLPNEAANRLLEMTRDEMMRDGNDRRPVGVDVAANRLLVNNSVPARWADLIVEETLRIAEVLPSSRLSLIGIPDRDAPNAVAEFVEAATRAVAEIADAGVHVDTVWLGDHTRIPSECFAGTHTVDPSPQAPRSDGN